MKTEKYSAKKRKHYWIIFIFSEVGYKMSQWGKVRLIDGHRFCVEVDAAPFVSARDDNTVLNVVFMDDFAVSEVELALLQKLKAQFISRPYRDWLSAAKHIPEA